MKGYCIIPHKILCVKSLGVFTALGDVVQLYICQGDVVQLYICQPNFYFVTR
jgi:hypothetical protein